MESFLKHTLIFILTLLFTFFFHSLVPIWNPLSWGYVFETQRSAKVNAEEHRGFVGAAGLMERGQEFYEGGNFSEAIKIWKKAVKAYQREQDKVNQALALNNLSLTYQESGEWEYAEVAISQALDILRLVPEKQAYAQALDTRGHLEYVQGKNQKALNTWKQSAQIYEQLNDNEGIIINQINQAQALQSLGSLHQAEDILSQLNKSLENQKYPGLKVTRLLSLANTYSLLGKLEKSNKILYEELDNDGIKKDEKIKILLSLGNTQRALANRARERREAKSYNEYQECKIFEDSPEEKKIASKALESYKKASDMAQEALDFLTNSGESAGSYKYFLLSTQIQAEINQLSLMLEINGEDNIKSNWQEVEKNVVRKLGELSPSRANIYAHINLAQSLNCFTSLQEDYNNKRKELLSTAVKQAQAIGDKRAESYALGNLGHFYEDENENKNKSSEALKYTKKALTIAKAYRSPDIAYRWEWQLGRIYEAQGNKQSAIKSYEAAVKTLKFARDYLRGTDSELQFSFRDSVEPVYRELVDLLLTDEDADEETSSQQIYFQKAIDKKKVNLEKAIDRIDELQLAEIENYFRCNLSQLVKVNQKIREKNLKAAFIYPIVLKDRLEVIYQLPGEKPERYGYNRETVKKSDFENTVKEARENLLNNREPEFKNQSNELYEWLIKPLIEEKLVGKDIETLVFVLDGNLQSIPMATLWDGKKFLVEKKYALSLLPSLQLFEFEELDKKENRILNVLFSGINKQLVIDTGENQIERLSTLPLCELSDNNEKCDKDTQIKFERKLLNENLTLENLQEEIKTGNYSIIHMSTHGQFSSNPEDTYIVISNENQTTVNSENQNDDVRDSLIAGKKLKGNDLDNLFRSTNQKDLGTIQLLVFNTCHSASGDNRATLGLAGIAIKSGARSTLSTLWRAADDVSAELMKTFYDELKGNHKKEHNHISKAEALHLAQKKLIEDKKQLYEWAPYVLIGNWL